MPCARIASLLASGTEIIHGLGLGDRLVAVSHECDFPPEVATLPRVTSTTIRATAESGEIDREVRERSRSGAPIYEIDADRLEAVAPDLVVTQAHCDVCAVDYDDVVAVVAARPSLQKTKIVALNPSTLDGIFEDIVKVGEAAEGAGTAARYVASLKGRVDAVRGCVADIPPDSRPRVVCLEWVEPVMVAANWMPELIDLAGGRCTLTQRGRPSSYTCWDDVVAFDPEVVVIMPCGFDLARALGELPACRRLNGWGNLSAVRNNRVYAVDGNAYFNRSGPRIVDSLEILAFLIHPDRIAATTQIPANAWRRAAST